MSTLATVLRSLLCGVVWFLVCGFVGGEARASEEVVDRLGGRVRAGMVMMGIDWQQETVRSHDDYPPYANFDQGLFGGPFGIGANGELWWDDTLGFDLSYHWATHDLDVGQDLVSKGESRLLVGGRYRYPLLSWLSVEGGGWFHHASATALKYVSGRNSAIPMDVSLNGLRIGAALVSKVSSFLVRFEAAETFGFAPADTSLEVTVDWALPDAAGGLPPLLVSLQYGFSMRWMSFEEDFVVIDVEDSSHVLGLSVGFAFNDLGDGGVTWDSDSDEEMDL